MILGTFGAAYMAFEYGAWFGVLGGIAFGAIGGLVHAIATVGFGVDHIVSGVAINIIAAAARNTTVKPEWKGSVMSSGKNVLPVNTSALTPGCCSACDGSRSSAIGL